MNRRTLTSRFELDAAPDWLCPTCQRGVLRIRSGTFMHEETLQSRDHSSEDWEPYMIEYVYSCMCVCSNDQCREVVATGGVGSLDRSMIEDEYGQPHDSVADFFRPTYFQPHLRLFQIPSGCPEAVSRPLNESFAIVFAVPRAALNCVRVAIEALLTALGVPLFRGTQGAGSPLRLHDRIEALPPQHSELRDLIMAAKWLGNAGSHDDGSDVTVETVADAYELMEHVLQEIYKPKVSRLAQLAQRVNQKKGPTT
jgi:hypothetical protein